MSTSKLIAAVLGAAFLGALTTTAKKVRQQKPSKVTPEDISRWEGEGGSPTPRPNKKI